jgi:hypothetical protein
MARVLTSLQLLHTAAYRPGTPLGMPLYVMRSHSERMCVCVCVCVCVCESHVCFFSGTRHWRFVDRG